MKKELNLEGLSCPKPVILTKKELENNDLKILVVTVDNVFSKENILKLCKNLNYESKVLVEEESLIKIEIKKENVSLDLIKEEKDFDLEDKCIMITTDEFGKGEKELSDILMKGFIYTLTESKPYPKHLILVNSGVKLSTINEATVCNLKILEENGVEILSCGTCLDYYDLKDNLKVGSVTNMYSIVEILKNVKNTVTL